MIDKLMACPFCGSDNIKIKEASNSDKGHLYAVICNKCNSTVFGDISKSDSVAYSNAKNRWNLRVYKSSFKPVVLPSAAVGNKNSDSPWIKYDDSDESTWPTTTDKLFLVGPTGSVFVGYYDCDEVYPQFHRSKTDTRRALYWMPIPEIPEV